MKKLPSSRKEQNGAPQPRNWGLSEMCQGSQLPCGTAVTCSWCTWDRGRSPALLWALVAQPLHLFLEDPEDPVRSQELVPAAGSPAGLVSTGPPTTTGWPWDESLVHPVDLPLALGAQGSHPCLAAPVVLAGPCGSSQTVLAPLVNQARQVALGDQVVLVDPRRDVGGHG